MKRLYCVLCILFVCGNSEIPEDQIQLCEFAMNLDSNASILFLPSTEEILGDPGERLMLTPYIEKGDFVEARRLSLVDATHMVKEVERSHAGFITVDKNFNSNLWFWYFPIQGGSDSTKAPLIIWLDGGPGTSFFFHFFEKVGLFSTINNGADIKPNLYTLHKDHSMLYIDSPVGTGFSFTDDENGYATNLTQISEQLYAFLEQFGELFPELRVAPIFIVGQSYAGKYIPGLVHQIHTKNPSARHKLNLIGIGIGSGWIDPINMIDYGSLLYHIGLADERLAKKIAKRGKRVTKSLASGDMKTAVRDFFQLMRTITDECGVTDMCNFASTKWDDPDYEYDAFAARPEIRKALHAGNTTFDGTSVVFCRLIYDVLESSKPWLEEAVEHYKVLLFSGQLDLLVPYGSSVKVYRSMNWTASQQFLDAERKQWISNGRLIGSYTTAGNFIDVLVIGSGHNTPGDKPQVTFDLIKKLTHGFQSISLNNRSVSSNISWDEIFS